MPNGSSTPAGWTSATRRWLRRSVWLQNPRAYGLPQRAFPPVGRRLETDRTTFAPYPVIERPAAS